MGKNGLWAGAILIGSLYFLYDGKNTSFKDSKEIKQIEIIAFRKTKPKKDAVGKYRAKVLSSLSAEQAKDLGKEYVTAYGKKTWVR